MSAQRTTSGEVQEILGTDLDPKRTLKVFLRTANANVDRTITCLSRKGFSLSAEEARLMEAWLTAHAYTRSDNTLASETTLSSSKTGHGQTAMDIDASFYGQQAKALDPSGSCLAAIMRGQRASGAWLGRAPSEQTDFADRS